MTTHYLCGGAAVLLLAALTCAPMACNGDKEARTGPTWGLEAEPQSIMDVLRGQGQFSTLVDAIEEANLEETLEGPGPFTLFAPTNDAFNRLPAGTLDDLLKDENRPRLRSVLTAHLAPNRQVSAEEAMRLSDIGTVQGHTLRPGVSNGQLTVDNARVVQSNIQASNGIIHAIDAVLMPSQPMGTYY